MENADISKILENISNKQHKGMVYNILTHKVSKVVKCRSSSCKGRIIAQIYENGSIIPVVNNKGMMFLLATRERLDGHLGFQCRCGNDSRLCEAEKGISGIENNAIQKSDIEEVWERLQKKPVNYPIKGKKQIVDKFLIEKI